MTRGKLVRRPKGQFSPVVETVEERLFPGQTLGFLGDFASQPWALADSGLNITIGGVTRRLGS
jgi:hypothetical protein